MKQVTMQASLKVTFTTLSNPTLKNLFIDIGGFEIMDSQGRIIPFDFSFRCNCCHFKDNCLEITYRSGLGCYDNDDIDKFHDDSYQTLGLCRNDITAKLLSEAKEFSQFYFSVHDRAGKEYPHIMTAAEISFYDENEKKYSVTPEALASVQQIYEPILSLHRENLKTLGIRITEI